MCIRDRYLHELAASPAVRAFVARIEKEPRATLLYASKNAEKNHARVLREYLERESG